MDSTFDSKPNPKTLWAEFVKDWINANGFIHDLQIPSQTDDYYQLDGRQKALRDRYAKALV